MLNERNDNKDILFFIVNKYFDLRTCNFEVRTVDQGTFGMRTFDVWTWAPKEAFIWNSQSNKINCHHHSHVLSSDSCATRYNGLAEGFAFILNPAKLLMRSDNFFVFALLVCFGCAYNVSLITPFHHAWLALLCHDGALQYPHHLTSQSIFLQSKEIKAFSHMFGLPGFFIQPNCECLLFTSTSSGWHIINTHKERGWMNNAADGNGVVMLS